ncbi:anion permease [Paraburkholderia terrae]
MGARRAGSCRTGALWIFADDYVNPTTAALMVIALMLVTRVVSWDDMLANKQAWNTFAWFATLVSLADGLSKTGFVKWFADMMSHHMSGFSPTFAAVILVLIFSSRTTCSPASPRIRRRCSPSC